MSVYVDPLVKYKRPAGAKASYSGKGELWCHMLADSLLELEGMARKLHLKPEWFQKHRRLIMCHYDLTPGVRTLAVKAGAVELTQRELRKLLLERIQINSGN